MTIIKKIYMKMTFCILFTCCTLFILGCKKEVVPDPPQARFSFTVYGEGFVQFNNESKNADTYYWTFGDGNSASTEWADHRYNNNGTYSVTLTAEGIGGSDESTQVVDISNISSTGQGVFYVNGPGPTFENISVSVSGSYVGTISYYYSTIYDVPPPCGESSCVTIERPAGTYPFTATSNSHYWSGNITITNGSCKTMKLNIN